MAFGYIFPDLNEDQKFQRRHRLDLHASIAQISAVLVILLLQMYYLLVWTIGKRLPPQAQELSRSPMLKYVSQNRSDAERPGSRSVRHFVTRFSWWSGEEISTAWGTKGQWLGGAIWTIWLAFLSINQTGNDYWHLTKRFGIVGASQLPLHYLLAIRTPYSPLQLLTRSSHEQLQAIHQVLGRIIVSFFSLHALFYLNGFVQMENLREKLSHRVIIIGLTSVTLFNIIGTTALTWIRKRNYRVFYGVHVIVSALLLPLLYFHVPHIRRYIWETLAVLLLNAILRAFSTYKLEAMISLIPETNLVRVEIDMTQKNAAAFRVPGQHVYLQIPRLQSPASTAIAQLQESTGLRSNPFTIVSLPELDRGLMLVSRALKGSTRELAVLGHSMAQAHSPIEVKLEGPYGASSWLPDFQTFDNIILVAGGVGATFVIPIWRSICMSRSASNQTMAEKVRFIWAVRKRVETSWAFPSAEAGSVLSHAPRGVEVYITGEGEAEHSNRTPIAGRRAEERVEVEEIEMSERAYLIPSNNDGNTPMPGLKINHGRPNLAGIVDDACHVPETRVAVLVCGPRKMGAELRRDVGRWIKKGRDVFWHAEVFGM